MNYKHCCSFQVKEVHLKKRDWGLAWFIASKGKFHTKFSFSKPGSLQSAVQTTNGKFYQIQGKLSKLP